ncbi:DcrB-related protein [Serratia sp. UGAL515B_01]|uniref:DcrB-related protein n=1 Tax=Serratia sp. UGAL515B_01 TaxID=2986763 RepID=UPI002953BB80|nr:DcrB-related protein [Serratia sp. UGAL515B_01]WON77470.1 DcrB-related protein [Serratia sp. UGAL515B_01]
MSMQNISYNLYEGTFLTPKPALDRSINLLMFRDPDENEYQIIVNRATLAEDQDLQAWCEMEMDNLRNKLPGFQVEGKMLKHEIGPAKLPVVQVANRYLHDGNTIHQVQSVVKLPKHSVYNRQGLDIMVFTLNASAEFSDFQRKHYVQVINSFSPEIETI